MRDRFKAIFRLHQIGLTKDDMASGYHHDCMIRVNREDHRATLLFSDARAGLVRAGRATFNERTPLCITQYEFS